MAHRVAMFGTVVALLALVSAWGGAGPGGPKAEARVVLEGLSAAVAAGDDAAALAKTAPEAQDLRAGIARAAATAKAFREMGLPVEFRLDLAGVEEADGRMRCLTDYGFVINGMAVPDETGQATWMLEKRGDQYLIVSTSSEENFAWWAASKLSSVFDGQAAPQECAALLSTPEGEAFERRGAWEDALKPYHLAELAPLFSEHVAVLALDWLPQRFRSSSGKKARVFRIAEGRGLGGFRFLPEGSTFGAASVKISWHELEVTGAAVRSILSSRETVVLLRRASGDGAGADFRIVPWDEQLALRLRQVGPTAEEFDPKALAAAPPPDKAAKEALKAAGEGGNAVARYLPVDYLAAMVTGNRPYGWDNLKAWLEWLKGSKAQFSGFEVRHLDKKAGRATVGATVVREGTKLDFDVEMVFMGDSWKLRALESARKP